MCIRDRWDAVPNGVTKEQYQPLDDYLDLSDDIWSDMSDVIEMFKYKDKHYVVPYCLSDPLLITYNRSLCEENGLDDPYAVSYTHLSMLCPLTKNGKQY